MDFAGTDNSGAKNLSRFFGEFIRRTENTDETVVEVGESADDNTETETPVQKTGDAISVSQLEQTLFANRQQISQPLAKGTTTTTETGTETTLLEELETPIADYKPLSTSKQHVYTINEMLSLSKEIPNETIETISMLLPKKKFWRLYQKHPEPRGANNKGRGLEGGYDKKMKNVKGPKPGNSNKRFNNKFGRLDKGNYIEENDINANNDDLIALEEEIGSSPNSMMDFEAWKAKMKDMERKKKGLAPLSDSGFNSNKEIPSRSSSSLNFSSTLGNGTNSISEFLNMANTKGNDESRDISDDVSNSDRNSTLTLSKDETAVESNIFDSKQTDEDKKAGSSRFSSFFSTTSKDTKTTTGQTNSSSNSPESAEMGLNKKDVNKSDGAQVGGSRLMSFFQAPQNENTNQESNTPTNNERPLLNNQNSDNSTRSFAGRDPRMAMDGSVGGTPVSLPVKLEQQGSMPHSQVPPHFNRMQSDQLPQGQHQMPPGMVFPPNPQNNSAFFQGLLTKGKANEQGGPTGPPQQMRQENKGGPNQQQMPPMGMPPPGFPMGMPPPNMMPPPGMAGFPNMPRGGQMPPHLEQQSDRKDGNPNHGNNSNINNAPPFMPGMGPPPPGFPPLPNIPMGFPSGQFQPNMGPPPMNQNNYGKVTMPMAQQNIGNFPNAQGQNMKQTDKK